MKRRTRVTFAENWRKVAAGLFGLRPLFPLVRPLSIVLLFTVHCSLFTQSPAQDDPPNLAPPPLKSISKQELSRLESETNLKDRTKLTLELMSARLTAAEKLRSGDDFDGIFRELGVFHGLMDNGLAYLQRRDTGSGKVLDNFKRIDIALRTFAPRLETIRREVPLSHEDYIRKLLIYVREARTKATEPLFADTVLPNRKPE